MEKNQKQRPTTGKKSLAYRGSGGQNMIKHPSVLTTAIHAQNGSESLKPMEQHIQIIHQNLARVTFRGKQRGGGKLRAGQNIL